MVIAFTFSEYENLETPLKTPYAHFSWLVLSHFQNSLKASALGTTTPLSSLTPATPPFAGSLSFSVSQPSLSSSQSCSPVSGASDGFADSVDDDCDDFDDDGFDVNALSGSAGSTPRRGSVASDDFDVGDVDAYDSNFPAHALSGSAGTTPRPSKAQLSVYCTSSSAFAASPSASSNPSSRSPSFSNCNGYRPLTFGAFLPASFSPS